MCTAYLFMYLPQPKSYLNKSRMGCLSEYLKKNCFDWMEGEKVASRVGLYSMNVTALWFCCLNQKYVRLCLCTTLSVMDISEDKSLLYFKSHFFYRLLQLFSSFFLCFLVSFFNFFFFLICICSYLFSICFFFSGS